MPTGLVLTNKIFLALYFFSTIYNFFTTSYTENLLQTFGSMLPLFAIAITVAYTISKTSGLFTAALVGNSLVSVMIVFASAVLFASTGDGMAVFFALVFLPIFLNVFFLFKEKRAKNVQNQ